MSITVKFFASLREELGKTDTEITAQPNMTVMQVWEQVCCDISMPSHTLMAINMQYVAADVLVNDGDEVAFFPPVTGG